LGGNELEEDKDKKKSKLKYSWSTMFDALLSFLFCLSEKQ
jgi:hypothetical protein